MTQIKKNSAAPNIRDASTHHSHPCCKTNRGALKLILSMRNHSKLGHELLGAGGQERKLVGSRLQRGNCGLWLRGLGLGYILEGAGDLVSRL